MHALWLTSLLACGDKAETRVGAWAHEKGKAQVTALDAGDDGIPPTLACEASYVLAGSHSVMVEDCTPYGLGEPDNPVCGQAYKNAFSAAGATRCPEPPPVTCPKRIDELWRGWKCGENPGLVGTFANCAVQVRVSCSQ